MLELTKMKRKGRGRDLNRRGYFAYRLSFGSRFNEETEDCKTSLVSQGGQAANSSK